MDLEGVMSVLGCVCGGEVSAALGSVWGMPREGHVGRPGGTGGLWGTRGGEGGQGWLWCLCPPDLRGGQC